MSRRSVSSRKSDSSTTRSNKPNELDVLSEHGSDVVEKQELITNSYKKYGVVVAVVIVLLIIISGVMYLVWLKKQKSNSDENVSTKLQEAKDIALKQQQVIESLHQQLLQTQEQLSKAVEKLHLATIQQSQPSAPIILHGPDEILFTEIPRQQHRPSVATIVEEDEEEVLSADEEEQIIEEELNKLKSEELEEKVEILDLKFDDKIISDKPQIGKKRGRKSKA